MVLNLGTPSQVSLFRHIADPKKVSLEKVKQMKHAKPPASVFSTAYKSRVAQSRGKSFFQPDGNESDNEQSRAPAPRSRYQPQSQSHHSRGRERDHHEEEYEEADGQEHGHEHGQEQDRDHDVDEELDTSSQVRHSGAGESTFEAEKSQVFPQIHEEEELEKQEFLNELKKFRGQTTREFTMQDTLTDIQFEYDRIKSNQNAGNVVRIMGIVLQVLVYAVQWGNGKFGPLLKLDNGETSWAMETSESISNREYDNVLEKLYRKHWRKGSMSPEAELGMMLVGSAGMFHFKTHVNEKLTKRSGSEGGSKGGGGSNGFNLMNLVGPVMGLMGGGGSGLGSNNVGSHQPQTQPSVPPPPKFNFVSGRSTNVGIPREERAAAPPPPPPPQGPSLVEMEQQFARRQQEMLSRLDEVTRRADEQMRASQARQIDLERQLQQTQLKLHQVSQQQHQVSQQNMHAFQQQQQLDMRRQHQQPPPQTQGPQGNLLGLQGQVQPRHYVPAAGQAQALRNQQRQLQAQSEATGNENTTLPAPVPAPGAAPSRPPPSPPMSPVNEDSDHSAGEIKFDVKEVMVTERAKRKRQPVALEIDELSIAL